MTDDRFALQNREFAAGQLFSDALRAHDLTPIVDDDYPEIRNRYESAVNTLIRAFTDNGRLPAARHPSPLDVVILEIKAELVFALGKFPTWPTRLIDAGNVVFEEAGELSKACLQVTYEPHKETLDGVRKEAIQTAAMAIRFLLSVDKYDCTPGPQHNQEAAA